MSQLGKRRLGRSDACVVFGSEVPASLTAAPEPGIPWDTLLLSAAGVAWCCRKCSTAVVAWITAPEQLESGASRPEGKPLAPATLLITRLDPPSGCSSWHVFCVAARFTEQCPGECLGALGVKQRLGDLGSVFSAQPDVLVCAEAASGRHLCDLVAA